MKKIINRERCVEGLKIERKIIEYLDILRGFLILTVLFGDIIETNDT